jgi:type II secretory pathway pseudopilin PulG
MKAKILHDKKGFSLIETILYAGILVFVMATLIYSFQAMSSSYHRMKSNKSIESSALFGMERMVREVRSATSIDLAQSVLDSSSGKLFLNTLDEDGVASTTEFFLSNQTLRVKVGGVDQGPLSLSSARVTNLAFHVIDTTQSKAVKIDMTVESGTTTSYLTKKFYDTSVLRGLYQ